MYIKNKKEIPMTPVLRAALVATVSLAATLLSPAAQAESFYVGLNRTTPGEAYADFAATRQVRNYNSPVALKLYGGMNLSDNYAIEIGVGDFGTWKMANPAAGSKEEVRISSKLLYVAGKASMPIGESVTAFAKLGIAQNKFSTEGTATASSSSSSLRPMLGFGATYSFTPHIAATLEFNYYGKAGNNFTQQKLELGLQYKF
jgi:opacity protein-like surface antigen